MRKRGLIYKIFQKLSRGMSPGMERAEKAGCGGQVNPAKN